jgi:hypothetical protein
MGHIIDYGIGSVPHERLDGVLSPVYFYTYENIQEAYDARRAVPTTVTLTIDHNYDIDTREMDVMVTASTSAALPAGDYRLVIALTESDIFYNGGNPIDIHDYTLRKFFPDHLGSSVEFAGDLPQTVQAMASWTLPTGDPPNEYVPENCEIVCYLQDANTLEVFQAAKELLYDPTPVAEVPASFRMERSYPNPFNPKTTIPVSMDRAGSVRLDILDVRGRLVRSLFEGELAPGSAEFDWDGRDDAGSAVSGGIYLARLSSGELETSQRLVMLK